MKKSAEHLQHNPQISLQPRSLQPSSTNPSHQNTTHAEQQVDTSFASAPEHPPSYNPFYHNAEQPSLGTNNLVPYNTPPYNLSYNKEQSSAKPISPDDVPSYPPPDYAAASEYPAMPSDDVPPPDYTTVVSSTTTAPQESAQQE